MEKGSYDYFVSGIPFSAEDIEHRIQKFNALPQSERTIIVSRIMFNAAKRNSEYIGIYDETQPPSTYRPNNKRKYNRITEEARQEIINSYTPPGRLFADGEAQRLANKWQLGVGTVYNLKSKYVKG